MNNFKRIYGSLKTKAKLYPKFWDANMVLKNEVKEKLIEISDHFEDNLDMDLIVSDVVLMGSIASYNWSRYSDVDIHLLIDFTQFPENQIELYKELFKLKKTVYNTKYSIKLYNHEVELYIQDQNELIYSSGIYSLIEDKWINKPEKNPLNIDDELLKSKVEDWKNIIDNIIESSKDKSVSEIRKITKKYKEKLKKYRKIGLSEGGENSVENLVFKVLRRNGYIKKLMEFQNKSVENKLSLREDLTDFFSEEPSVEDYGFWSPLVRLIKSGKTISRADYPGDGVTIDADVMWIQAALDFILEEEVAMDGMFGKGTEKAIKKFETKYNLPVDGVLDTEDLKKIGALLLANKFSEAKYKKIKERQYYTIPIPQEDKVFYLTVLKGIGAPITPENVRFMAAWRQSEGANSRNNPFNTTYVLDKDKNMQTYGSHKIKHYSTPEYGMEATIKTLMLPKYECLIENLKRGDNAIEAAQCPSIHTWGTGELLLKVLRNPRLKPPKIAR